MCSIHMNCRCNLEFEFVFDLLRILFIQCKIRYVIDINKLTDSNCMRTVATHIYHWKRTIYCTDVSDERSSQSSRSRQIHLINEHAICKLTCWWYLQALGINIQMFGGKTASILLILSWSLSLAWSRLDKAQIVSE